MLRRLHVLGLAAALLTASLAACTSSGGGGGGASSAAPATGGSTAPTPVLRAGAARVDVTPPTGCPLGGYGGGPRRPIDAYTLPLNFALAIGSPYRPNPASYATFFAESTGSLDAVCAKAVVYERHGERYAVLGIDAIGISRKARDDIAAKVVAAGAGIDPDRLLVAATHTHSGPAAIADKVLWQLAAMDLLDPRIYDPFVDRCAAAIIQAAASLEPALVATGVVAEGSVQRNRRGAGIVDPELTTVSFHRPDGSVIGTLVNLAIHGICLDADNMAFSADLMGVCEREVEASLGRGAVCVFLNGAEGDVSPNHYGPSGMQQLGLTIAAAALRTIQAAASSAEGDVPLAASYETFRFRYAPVLALDKVGAAVPGGLPTSGQMNLGPIALALGNIPIVMDGRWMNMDIPVQALRIGGTCLISVPGEPITQVGLDLKAAARGMGFAHPVVVGLANDHLGYVTTPHEYDRGGYEALMTFFGREEGVELTSAVLRQVDRVKP